MKTVADNCKQQIVAMIYHMIWILFIIGLAAFGVYSELSFVVRLTRGGKTIMAAILLILVLLSGISCAIYVHFSHLRRYFCAWSAYTQHISKTYC